MTAPREYGDYLRDMLEAIDKAREFTEGLEYQSFIGDAKTVFAVIRALEVLGEASKKIPKSVRDKHPSISWRAMSGMRDRLIHGYFGVMPWAPSTRGRPSRICRGEEDGQVV